MSHKIIIIGGGDGGGRIAGDGTAEGSVEWTPSHDLSPQQVQNRIDRAQRKLDRIEAMLTAPVGEELDE